MGEVIIAGMLFAPFGSQLSISFQFLYPLDKYKSSPHVCINTEFGVSQGIPRMESRLGIHLWALEPRPRPRC